MIPQLRAQYPDLQPWQLGETAISMWGELPQSEKKVYEKEHDADMKKWDEQMKAYRGSEGYKKYLRAKDMSGLCRSVGVEKSDDHLEEVEIKNNLNLNYIYYYLMIH